MKKVLQTDGQMDGETDRQTEVLLELAWSQLKMVNVSQEFKREYEASFNAKKTVCMCFGDQVLFKQLRHIVLNDTKISKDTSEKHLGNMLSSPQNDACDVISKWDKSYPV